MNENTTDKELGRLVRKGYYSIFKKVGYGRMVFELGEVLSEGEMVWLSYILNEMNLAHLHVKTDDRYHFEDHWFDLPGDRARLKMKKSKQAQSNTLRKLKKRKIIHLKLSEKGTRRVYVNIVVLVRLMHECTDTPLPKNWPADEVGEP